MSNPTLANIHNKIRDSLIQQGFITEENTNYLQTSPSNFEYSNSFKELQQFNITTRPSNTKATSSDQRYPSNNNYITKELASLRRDLTLNIQLLRQDFEQKIQKNSNYVYNEELSKFRTDQKETINNFEIEIQELWLRITNMQKEMNELKGSLNENKEKMNKIYSKADHESNNAQLLKKVEEINKKSNELSKSMNQLNNNGKVYDKNINIIANKLKRYKEDVKEIKEYIPILKNGVNNEYVQPQINKKDFIGQNEFKKYKEDIENKFALINEKFINEINLLKNENKSLKERISELQDSNNNNNNDNYNRNSNDFIQFSTDQKHLNEDYSKRLKTLEEKTEETEQKINSINEQNQKNFQSIDENINEVIFEKINNNEKDIQILQQSLHNIKDNHENLKKEIIQYKVDLAKWQNQLIDQNDKRFQSITKPDQSLNKYVDSSLNQNNNSGQIINENEDPFIIEE